MDYRIRITKQARATKSDKSKVTIFLRVFPTWERGKDFIISTKISLDKNKWNDVKKSAIGSSYESTQANKVIPDLVHKITNLFEDYIRTTDTPSISHFKKYIENKLYGKWDDFGGGKIKMDGLFDHFLKSKEQTIGAIRKKRYQFLGRKVNEFNIVQFGKANVDFEVLNYEWRLNFKNFLKNQFDYKPSTINGYLKVLHSAIRHACKTGKIKYYPFVDGEYEKVEESTRYLTLNEYRLIENFRSSDERLMRTANIFVFACNTGLSYCDLKSLNKSDIEKDDDGNVLIKKLRGKTKGLSIIPLNKLAVSIINEFRDHPALSGTDLLLPVIHMNDYNQLLKLIASKCNIEKNISSHVARHTFATTIWMNNGGTLDGLKGTLGHMKISTTERYVNILEEKIKKDASKVFANQDKKRALHSDKTKFNDLKNDE